MPAPTPIASLFASYTLTNSNEINQTNAGGVQINVGSSGTYSVAMLVMCPGATDAIIDFAEIDGIALTPVESTRIAGAAGTTGTMRAFKGEGLSGTGLKNWRAGRNSGATWGWEVIIRTVDGDTTATYAAQPDVGVGSGVTFVDSIASSADSLVVGLYTHYFDATTWTGSGGTTVVQGALASAGYQGLIAHATGASPTGSINVSPNAGEAICGGLWSFEAVGGGDTTAPTITGPAGAAGAASISLSVAENTTACGTWTADETVTWSISGPDAALFSIGSSSGVLAFLSPPNFEAPGDAGANNTYDLTVTATDGASNASTQSVAINVTDVAEDGTNPSAPGTPTFSSVTKNSATVSWAAATDNVGVAGYERRVAGGSIVNLGNVLTFSLSGGTPGASVLVEVRAYDAAGNRGAWASATLTYLIWGFDFDDPALDLEIGNVSGTLVGLGMVSSTAWTIRVSDVATGALVHSFSASTNAAGVLPRLQHAALDAGVYEVRGMTTEADPLNRMVWAILIEATTP